jgi:hypothetical protein
MLLAEMKFIYKKNILLSITWIFLQACSLQHYSHSLEHDDLYFTSSDSKKWQVKKNPSYDPNYKAPTPTPAVVDPNVYQFSSGQASNSNNNDIAVSDNTSTIVTRRNTSGKSRIRTNFMVGSMFGPGGGYNSYNHFNISWFYSDYYGYNSYWSPYTYTPYYCNTYINPYAGLWYGSYAMPMYSYGYNNYGYYNMYGNTYGYYHPYGYYPPMYFQPTYMSYPTYYTPQSGYNTVATPTPAYTPKPMTGSTTGNSNYPSGNTASPYQNKAYTPATSQPNSTTSPRGSQYNSTTQPNYNPAPQQQPRQSYTPQNSYHPPQQNYNPAPRGGGGGGSTGTPNPRMR